MVLVFLFVFCLFVCLFVSCWLLLLVVVVWGFFCFVLLGWFFFPCIFPGNYLIGNYESLFSREESFSITAHYFNNSWGESSNDCAQRASSTLRYGKEPSEVWRPEQRWEQ